MHKILPVIFALLSLSALFGCESHSTPEQLLRARAIMDIYPDSTLRLLLGVKTDTLPTDRDRAYHAMLLGEAYETCKLNVANDSLMRAAAAFYAANGPDSMRMKSLYYLGCAEITAQNATTAMNMAEDALKEAEKQHNFYWMGKCCTLIHNIFYWTYNHADALRYSKLASQYFLKGGRQVNYLYSKSFEASDYININNFDMSRHIVDSLLTLDYTAGDIPLLQNCYKNLLELNLRSYNNEEAVRVVQRMDSLGLFKKPMYGWYRVIADLNYRMGNYSEMYRFIDSARVHASHPNDYMGIHGVLLNFYRNQKRFEEATLQYDSVLDIVNNQVLFAIEQSGMKVQRNNALTDLEAERHKVRTERMVYGSIGGALLLLLVTVCIILRQRKRIAELELDGKIRSLNEAQANVNRLSRQASLLSETVEQESRQNKALESTNRRLLRQRWEFANRICTLYQNKKDSKLRHTIVNDIEKELNRLGSSRLADELEEMLDITRRNIVADFRADFGQQLRETDIQMSVYLFSGIPITTIYSILGISRSQAYKRKNVIIELVSESRVARKDEYLELLDPPGLQ